MRVGDRQVEMVCGQLVLKMIYFFIDTNHLEDTLSWAPDLMDLDSNDENEGILFFPKLKQSSNAIDSRRFWC
jgi:hypothetical protein